MGLQTDPLLLRVRIGRHDRSATALEWLGWSSIRCARVAMLGSSSTNQASVSQQSQANQRVQSKEETAGPGAKRRPYESVFLLEHLAEEDWRRIKGQLYLGLAAFLMAQDRVPACTKEV